MKVSILSNAYSCLNPKIKGKAWRSLTDAELLALKNEKQVISNCYDVAVRYALLAIEKGKEIFRNVIKISKNPEKSRTCKITFNINGKKKSYRSITSETRTVGELIGSSVGKMIRCNPSEKPFISRFGRFGFHRYQEFNKPSNAFYWYTGKKPISIGEDGLYPSLQKYKDKVVELLNKIADKKGDSSFVVISSYKQSPLNGQRRWHCLPIVNVDKAKKQLQIINKRTDEVITLNFEEFIDNFKAIVGIFHT